jgi:tRNA(Ile)-lysidine synthase
MPPGDLLAGVAAFVADRELFPEPGRALVAVSGGADSTALLYLLCDLACTLGLTLAVGHVEHGIHEASSAWAVGVAELAARLAVPYEQVALGLGPGTSETQARRARYRALARLQRQLDARYLVTAHHADDQVETVLLRFLRGSGIAGLAGMAPAGPGSLVRPLLPFRRSEIAAWLAHRAPDAAPHLDPANASPVHDRSWVRAALLPLLRERFPDVDGTILDVQRQAALERAAWEQLLHAHPDLELRRLPGGIEVARGPVARYDKALSVALLRALVRAAGHHAGVGRAERIRHFAARAASGRQLDLGDGWIVEAVFDRLVIRRPPRRSVVAPAAELAVEGAAGEACWGDWCIKWYGEPAGVPHRAGLITWVTAGPLVVRGRHVGDRIRPLGGVGRRAVRRVLMEARVSRWERPGYPLVVRGADVLWVPGVCRADRAVPQLGAAAIRLEARRRAAGEAGA